MRSMVKAIAPISGSEIGEIDSPRADTTSDDVADIITAAVNASRQKAMAIAAKLGMSPSYFSEACSGKRSVSINRLLTWVREDPEAGLALVNALCALLELEPTKPKPRVDKRAVIERMLSFLRYTAEWESHVPKVARELGVTESDVRKMVDAPTGEFRIPPDSKKAVGQ